MENHLPFEIIYENFSKKFNEILNNKSNIKLHFDYCNVMIDGGRSKWCIFLFLDAIITFNKKLDHRIARRTFNQHLILEESIILGLKEYCKIINIFTAPLVIETTMDDELSNIIYSNVVGKNADKITDMIDKMSNFIPNEYFEGCLQNVINTIYISKYIFNDFNFNLLEFNNNLVNKILEDHKIGSNINLIENIIKYFT